MNDQPLPDNCKRFIYADDLCLTTQQKTFNQIEQTLEKALDKLGKYYHANHLKPNPAKTSVSAFHLNNRAAGKKLSINWEGTQLEHSFRPVYLGVTLDRAPTFKEHIKKTIHKVSTRNNLLRRLANSNWGAEPSALRTTALALFFSVAEYACPTWARSNHAAKINTVLNDTCRTVTGCLRPTPLPCLYALAGIAPPDIRRSVISNTERATAEADKRHPLHNHGIVPRRLTSRVSFMDGTDNLDSDKRSARESAWLISWNALGEKSASWVKRGIIPTESLASGNDLPWAVWKTLNRLRVGVARCKASMKEWRLALDAKCECGETQTNEHLLSCSLAPACTAEDLAVPLPTALDCATYWSDKI